jgi:multimeric flavodoxin WrbA
MTENLNKLKLLAIMGSPRKNGNTDRLVDEVLKGSESQNVIYDKVYLSDLNFDPCRACDACKKNKHCVVNDDYSKIFDLMKTSNIWILGTPVYFWGPTGWFKAFVDRWYGSHYEVDFSSKKAVIVIPFESSDIKTVRHTIGMIEDSLNYMKVEIISTLVAPGLKDKNDIMKNDHYLKQANKIGKDIINTYNCQVDCL